MKFVLAFIGFLSLNVGFTQNDTLTIVTYNLLNFPDGRNDCGSGNINLPNRTDSLRKILGYLKPDIFVACEIQTKAGADSVLTRSLNVFGASNYHMAPFIYSNGGGGALNNAMYYNSDKLIFLRQKPILTSSRDINHYTLMVKDPNIAQHRDTIFIEVHMAHLKAGSASANVAERATQTQVFRSYVESKPLMRNHIFCGDLNVYTSNEQGYQNLIAGGNNPFFDPIFSPGSWTNNAAFSAIHTQSPRSTGTWACGATGGMDDRFDQILVTQNVLSGADGLNYLANSYKAVGNDGQHFNTSLLSPPANSQYPDSVVNAIFYLSDHLPVMMKMVPILPTSNGLALTYSHNGPLCSGNSNGTASVVPLHGVAPYSYLWDANAGNQTTSTATNLAPGSYCVTVSDNNGLSDTVCFEIESIPGPTMSLFANASSVNCDGQATAIVSGGTAPYVFSWNDPLNQNTQTATGLCPGTYICTVTDQGGCTIQSNVVIQEVVGLLEYLKEKGEIQVRPNPFSNEIRLYVQSHASTNIIRVVLRNLEGKSLKEFPVHSNEKEMNFVLNTVDLSSGVYFVEIQSDTDKTVFKVMK